MNFGEKEGKASGSGFRKSLLCFFFFNNILLMWKIVGVSKALVLILTMDSGKPVLLPRSSSLLPGCCGIDAML